MFSIVRNSSTETEPIWTIDWECQTLVLWGLVPSDPLSRTESSFSISESWVSAACVSSQPFFSCENLTEWELYWVSCWKSWPGDASLKDGWQERQLSLIAGQFPYTSPSVVVASKCLWATWRRHLGFRTQLCRQPQCDMTTHNTPHCASTAFQLVPLFLPWLQLLHLPNAWCL